MRQRQEKKTAQQLADEVVTEASGVTNDKQERFRGRKRRLPSSLVENESHEILPDQVKMSELVKDSHRGKPSRREAEMEKIDWAEVKRKRHEAVKEAIKEEQRQKESKKNGPPLPAPGPHATERLVLVNGQMVIEESSRVVDRSAATIRDAEQSGEAISEDKLTARVNQATVGRRPSTRIHSMWNEEETEKFYQGLRMFGTDFMMISKMFPDTARGIIKRKFTKEERLHPHKIQAALNAKDPVDLQALSEITNTTYDSPEGFYQELVAEKARLEAEDARTRAENAPTDHDIQESIEQGDGEPTTNQDEQSRRNSRNRFAEEARAIIDGPSSSRKQKTTKTRKTTTGKKNKDMEKSQQSVPPEGIEEMVGTIADFDP